MKNKKMNQDFYSCFKKYIKYFDQFNIQFDFRVGENLTYQTFAGGLTYMLCLLIIIIYAIFSLITLFSVSEFNVRFYSEKTDTQIHLDKEKFFYSILIRTTDKSCGVDNDYFYLEHKLIKRFNYTDLTIERTEGFSCSESKKAEEILNKSFHIRNNELSEFYCFDTPDFNLKGNYLSKNFEFLEIHVQLNLTTYLRDPTEMDRCMEYYEINFLYIDKDVNFKKGIIEDTINSVRSKIFWDYYETFDIYYAPLDIKIDRNYFIKDYSYNSTFKYLRQEKFITFNKNTENLKINDRLHINRFYLRVDREMDHIDIYYEKIPQLLSNFLALNQTIFFIFNFLMSRWNSLKTKEYIFSRVFKNKDSFYINFKNLNHIYNFEKPQIDSLNFGNNREIEDKFHYEKKDKSNEQIINENFNKQIELRLEKAKYLKEFSTIDLSTKRKHISETSQQKKSSLNDENFEIKNNSIKSRTIKEIDKSITLLNSHDSSKINEISEINYPKNITNLNQINKSGLDIKNEENKMVFNDLSDYYKHKTNNDSNQILDELIRNTQKKSTGSDGMKEIKIDPLRITGYDYFLRYIMCNKKYLKKKLNPFKLAEKNLNFYLDITTYMIKMNEFEMLKTILIQKDFKVLLEFISKPIITSDSSKELKLSFEKIVSNSLAGRNFFTANTQINEATFDQLLISYKNMKQILIENQDENKINYFDYKKNVENFFEKQMEFLFNDS